MVRILNNKETLKTLKLEKVINTIKTWTTIRILLDSSNTTQKKNNGLTRKEKEIGDGEI